MHSSYIPRLPVYITALTVALSLVLAVFNNLLSPYPLCCSCFVIIIQCLCSPLLAGNITTPVFLPYACNTYNSVGPVALLFSTWLTKAVLYPVSAWEAEENSLQRTQHGCAICGKVFHLLNSLTKHMKVHNGETECSLCGRVLNRKSYLKRHYLVVHNVQMSV